MGTFPKKRFVNPGAWGDVEIDLMGTYTCRSNVNKQCTLKVWGAVIEDINSRAVYCDIVSDDSTEAVISI